MGSSSCGADADTALVEEVPVTPANVNEGKAGPDAKPSQVKPTDDRLYSMSKPAWRAPKRFFAATMVGDRDGCRP
jgi:hypothetical protein